MSKLSLQTANQMLAIDKQVPEKEIFNLTRIIVLFFGHDNLFNNIFLIKEPLNSYTLFPYGHGNILDFVSQYLDFLLP